jgi:hypothetical protein
LSLARITEEGDVSNAFQSKKPPVELKSAKSEKPTSHSADLFILVDERRPKTDAPVSALSSVAGALLKKTSFTSLSDSEVMWDKVPSKMKRRIARDTLQERAERSDWLRKLADRRAMKMTEIVEETVHPAGAQTPNAMSESQEDGFCYLIDFEDGSSADGSSDVP